jgi:chromosome segregation ATPase
MSDIESHCNPAQRIAELEAQIEGLKDPACVWANMLRGTIARPQALDHYEECKANVERLERENAELKAQNVTFRNAQKACEDCDAPTMEELTKLRAELANICKVVENAQVSCPNGCGTVTELRYVMPHTLRDAKAVLCKSPSTTHERDQLRAHIARLRMNLEAMLSVDYDARPIEAGRIEDRARVALREIPQ